MLVHLHVIDILKEKQQLIIDSPLFELYSSGLQLPSSWSQGETTPSCNSLEVGLEALISCRSTESPKPVVGYVGNGSLLEFVRGGDWLSPVGWI